VIKLQTWFRKLVKFRQYKELYRVRSDTPDLFNVHNREWLLGEWLNNLPTFYINCDRHDSVGNPLIDRGSQRCPVCDHLIGGRYLCLPDMCCRVRKCTGCDQQIVNSSSCFCNPVCEHKYNVALLCKELIKYFQP